MIKPHIWLRAETKKQEQRTALTPTNARHLLDAGFKVTVERSEQNIFNNDLYQQINCSMAEQGSWKNAPKNAIILGLKELPADNFPLIHQHIYFAHAYKEQNGWQNLLTRFKSGNGQLFDLEYLLDANNRRVAAFGFWAGFAGAALAALAWANKQQGLQPPLAPIESYSNKQCLIDDISKIMATNNTKPRMLIIGAKGRSGCGAVSLANELDIEVVEWDLAETKKGGPFIEINQMDILVNCVLISGEGSSTNLPPFITTELLEQTNRKLAMIADISCDPYGSYNPLPIYQQCTTFKNPCLNIIEGDNPLDLIAIDHLPSLLPKESSEDYGQQLVEHLLSLDNLSNGVWPKALALFKQKSAII
ncbi:MAG: saccharopine dehydrogenase [Alteromonadaceae bacterium]|nr:saccharopine dehydrogenase [Alteromonadaceae bacterium]